MSLDTTENTQKTFYNTVLLSLRLIFRNELLRNNIAKCRSYYSQHIYIGNICFLLAIWQCIFIWKYALCYCMLYHMSEFLLGLSLYTHGLFFKYILLQGVKHVSHQTLYSRLTIFISIDYVCNFFKKIHIYRSMTDSLRQFEQPLEPLLYTSF